MPARGGRRAISHDHHGRARHDRNEPEWPTIWVDLPTPALQSRLPGATPKQPFSYNDLPTLGQDFNRAARGMTRSEEHTSELQSLMRISYAVFCLKKKTNKKHRLTHNIVTN